MNHTVLDIPDFGFAIYIEFEVDYTPATGDNWSEPYEPEEISFHNVWIWQADENNEPTGQPLSWSEWKTKKAIYDLLEEDITNEQ